MMLHYLQRHWILPMRWAKRSPKKMPYWFVADLGGVMEYACRGAKDNGGLTVGIIPQEDYSHANKFCDIVICSGIGKSRDFIVSYSSDGIISVGGGVGTLIELCVGYMAKKIMVSIEDSGGVSDIYGGNFLDERKRIKIEKSKSPSFAVDFIIQKLYAILTKIQNLLSYYYCIKDFLS